MTEPDDSPPPGRASTAGPLAFAFLGAMIALRVLSYLWQRFAGLRSGEGMGLEALADPWFFASVGTLIAASVVWPQVLRRMPLRRAYPFTALVPPLNLAAAATLADEAVTPTHGVAMAIVAAGVWVVAGRRR